MTISIIHGVNLSHLGQREPEIYGSETLDSIDKGLKATFPKVTFRFFQSDVEGELVKAIWEASETSQGIVLNPGAYTHTSVTIRDAVAGVAAMKIPTVEVHLSNIQAREPFRRESLIASVCLGQIQGFGAHSYHLAVQALIK
jgi:3-dehydroquinate dehydratase-2